MRNIKIRHLTLIFSLTLIMISILPITFDYPVITTLDHSSFIQPVKAQTEEEIFDTFDVHPLNRWNITNDGFTTTSHNSLLNITDTGDGSYDMYRMERAIDSYEETVKIRFKFDVNLTDYHSGSGDYLRFWLYSPITGSYVYYECTYLAYYPWNSSKSARIYYSDTDGEANYIRWDYDENGSLVPYNWYILEINYDFYLSELSWRMTFDNGTEVFEYTWQDVRDYIMPSEESSGNMDTVPAIFGDKDLTLRLDFGCWGNGYWIKNYLDYVYAPFKTREWFNYDVPTNENWSVNSFQGHRGEDDLDDTSGWELNVPYLDSVACELGIDADSELYFDLGDLLQYNFTLFTVDSTDGSLTEAIKLSIQLLGTPTPAACVADFAIYLNGTYNLIATSLPAVVSDWIQASFVITLRNDRSTADIEMWSGIDTTSYQDRPFIRTINFSDVTDDLSSEFQLRIDAKMDFTGSSLSPEFTNYGVNIYHKERWKDYRNLPIKKADNRFDPIGDLAKIVENAWNFATDTISKGLESLGTFLKPLFQAISNAVAAIWSNIQPYVSYIIGWAIDVFQTISDEIIGFLALWFFFAYDNLPLWDVLGISPIDFLAIFSGSTLSDLLGGLVNIITNFPQLLSDIFDAIFYYGTFGVCFFWAWVIFFGFWKHGFDPGAGVNEVFSRIWAGPDVTLFGNGPFHVPAGLVIFIPLTGFLILSQLSVWWWIW